MCKKHEVKVTILSSCKKEINENVIDIVFTIKGKHVMNTVESLMTYMGYGATKYSVDYIKEIFDKASPLQDSDFDIISAEDAVIGEKYYVKWNDVGWDNAESELLDIVKDRKTKRLFLVKYMSHGFENTTNYAAIIGRLKK